MRTLQEVIDQAMGEVLGTSERASSEHIVRDLLAEAMRLEAQAKAADDRAENEGVTYDTEYVDTEVARRYRIAALARKLALELVLDHQIRPADYQARYIHILAQLDRDCRDEMVEELNREYLGCWRTLTDFSTWPPNMFTALAVEARSGIRPPQEIFDELRARNVIRFYTYAERKYAPTALEPAWQEAPTAEYQILFAINPHPEFLLAFPQERGDLAAAFQNLREDNECSQTRPRFIANANANTAGWMETILEDYPEFQVTDAAWQVIADFTNLPGYDYF